MLSKAEFKVGKIKPKYEVERETEMALQRAIECIKAPAKIAPRTIEYETYLLTISEHSQGVYLVFRAFLLSGTLGTKERSVNWVTIILALSSLIALLSLIQALRARCNYETKIYRWVLDPSKAEMHNSE